jgi:hypothetical protein
MPNKKPSVSWADKLQLRELEDIVELPSYTALIDELIREFEDIEAIKFEDIEAITEV